jgi:hypothetical protein
MANDQSIVAICHILPKEKPDQGRNPDRILLIQIHSRLLRTPGAQEDKEGARVANANPSPANMANHCTDQLDVSNGTKQAERHNKADTSRYQQTPLLHLHEKHSWNLSTPY